MATPAVSLQFRGIYVQDFATSASFAQVSDTVLGLGSVSLTPLVLAASDAAANSAGVPVGGVYVNNGGSFAYIRTRMT